MRFPFILALIVAVAAPSSTHGGKQSFREQQLQYARVRTSAKEKDEILRRKFNDKILAYPPHAVLFRAFKKEGLLEMWGANSDSQPHILVWTYKICASSGTLGPKRSFGDEQVPEGFYLLDWFNPQSNFFLSLHVSYPNAADRILGSHENPGGDIFLHGNCVTIGCLPITDDGIKEVYWVSVLARTNGQQSIPIQIFPARLTDEGFRTLAITYRARPELIAFWSNLKEGFDFFEKSHKPPTITTAADGAYKFAEGKSGRRDR